MKRTFATLGVAGLALLSVSAPAIAADNFTICHKGKTIAIDLNGVGLGGHNGHEDDIIPPNAQLPGGSNWPVGGDPSQACLAPTPVVVVPPAVVDPPAEVDVPVAVVPPAEVAPPAVVTGVPAALTPAAQTPAPQVAAPKAPAAKAPAAKAPAAKAPAAVSKGTNQGFNAQTAVGGADDSTTWLAGLGMLLGAGAVVAVRRRSRTESPLAG